MHIQSHIFPEQASFNLKSLILKPHIFQHLPRRGHAPISAFLSTCCIAPNVHVRLPSLFLELREASQLDKGQRSKRLYFYVINKLFETLPFGPLYAVLILD